MNTILRLARFALIGAIVWSPSGALLYAAEPCIKHAFVSGKADSADTTIVRPSDWNACHTIDDGAIGASKMAVVNTRRTCIIENDTQSATALTDAQITGRCDVMQASHVVEVAVFASGGTPTLTLERWRPNGGTTADILSGSLATGASGAYACAMPATSGTCISGVTSSGTITLAGAATVALAAGDVIRVKAATAGGTATWHHVVVTMTVD